MNINGCQECEGCLDYKKTAGCQQEDDMNGENLLKRAKWVGGASGFNQHGWCGSFLSKLVLGVSFH